MSLKKTYNADKNKPMPYINKKNGGINNKQNNIWNPNKSNPAKSCIQTIMSIKETNEKNVFTIADKVEDKGNKDSFNLILFNNPLLFTIEFIALFVALLKSPKIMFPDNRYIMKYGSLLP